MRILVLDQCSRSKSYPEGSPTFSLEDLEGRSREALLDEDGVAAKKARNLYDGRQQRRIDGAVDALRDASHHVDRYFVSAGFGLVEETELLPPYDVTFREFSDDEIRDRAECLGLQEAVSELLASVPAYDVAFLALGKDYYTAIGFPDVLEHCSDTITVVFNSEVVGEGDSTVISIPARTPQARERGVNVIELKGRYFQNFVENLLKYGSLETRDEVREACLREGTEQADIADYE